MFCPHCQKTTKSKVHESRPAQGEVWRRRFCLGCLKVFVSQEIACEVGTIMPRETRSAYRVVDKKPKPGQRIMNDASHLQSVWR